MLVLPLPLVPNATTFANLKSANTELIENINKNPKDNNLKIYFLKLTIFIPP